MQCISDFWLLSPVLLIIDLITEQNGGIPYLSGKDDLKKKKIKNHDFLSYDVVTFALRIATFRMHNEPINKNHFREYLVF